MAAPEQLTKTGYVFDGWYKDTACTQEWKFDSDTVSSDMALYAKWTAAQYTVTFDANHGTLTGSDTKKITYDSTYGELPVPTRTGYVFDGWYTQADGGDKVEAATPVTATADLTLYAHWTASAVSYTVKHLQQNVEDHGYTEVTDDRETLSGPSGQPTQAQARTYTGFRAQAVTQQPIAADGTTVVEIKYDRLTYTVTWMNGDTELETDTAVKYGATPSYDGEAPTKTGTGHTYAFTGWSPEIATVTADTT